MNHAQGGQWHLYGGRDPRGLPSYTTREAARYVRRLLSLALSSHFLPVCSRSNSAQ